MNKPLIAFLLIVFGIGMLVSGCGDDEDCVNCPASGNPFVPQTSPEAVVANLAASYRLRAVEEYSKLLAPEFVFQFQPTGILEPDTWTRDQDSTGTAALFGSLRVDDIRIDLTHGGAAPADTAEFPAGTMMIRINQTQLEVDQIDGITWRVTDPQDMFFRPGQSSAGEDPDRWFLLEWRDIPNGLILHSPTATERATWGGLKTLYLSPG